MGRFAVLAELFAGHGFGGKVRAVNNPSFALGRARNGAQSSRSELEEALRQAAFFYSGA